MASAPIRGFSVSSARRYLLVAAGCVLAKLALALFDPGVLLHSDSGNYVRDAFELSPSWPRPIAYGFFLRAVFELTGGGLSAVTLAHALLGAGVGVATYALAERCFDAPRGWSLTAAALVTLSPLALVMERYILSDTLGLAALVAAVAALFVFVRRPAWWSALLLGLGATLPLLVRAAWVFLPPLAVALALIGTLGRGTGGFAARWPAVGLSALALVLSAALFAGYSAAFSARNTDEVTLASGGSGFAGWVLWGSVARFAEPDDLAGFPHADLLLSDHESLARNGSWQIWDFQSTANRLRQERFDGSFTRTNPHLLDAALRVAVRHPLGFARQLGWSLLRFFRPIQGNNDYSRLVNVDASSLAHIDRTLGPGAAPDPLEPPRLGPALRAWRWLRWLWSGLLFVALGVGLLRPRRRFELLAIGAFGVAYLLVVNIAIGFVFVERYFLPVEYLGILALAAVAAALSSPPAPAEARVA